MGYAYCVFKDQAPFTSGAYGACRGGIDTPQVPWDVSMRMNLASVSKTVTAVAMMALDVANNASVLDDNFWPKIQRAFPGVKKDMTFLKGILCRNLLTMNVSGTIPDHCLSVTVSVLILGS